MKIKTLLLAVTLGLGFTALANAAPVFQITTDFKSYNVNSSSELEVDFYVKNNSSKALPVYFVNTFGSAVTQLTGPVSSIPTCENGMNIKSQESCVLRLNVNGPSVNKSFSLSPKVCYDPKDTRTCSFPSDNQRASIKLNNVLHNQIKTPFHVALMKGGNVVFNVTNNTGSTLHSVELILPSTYQSLIGNITNTCNNVLTGSHCHFNLNNITNNNVKVPPTMSAVIRGLDNSGNPITADITMTFWWDGVQMRLSDEQHLQYQGIVMDALPAYQEVVTSSIYVSDGSVSGPIELCDKTFGSSCDYNYQTACISTLNILPSCTAWIHAYDDYFAEDIAVDLQLHELSNGQTINYEKNFLGEYNVGLYAGVESEQKNTSTVYFNDLNEGGWELVSNGPLGTVKSLALFNGDLYVGGIFSKTGDGAANNVARWDGSVWSALTDLESDDNGTRGPVYSLTAAVNEGAFAKGDPIFDYVLIVGGSFNQVGDELSANNVATWCPANNNNGCEVDDMAVWSPLQDANNNNDNGVNGPVHALAFDQDDGVIFVGGKFNTASSVSANNVALWDFQDWSGLLDTANGNGVNGPVYSLAWDDAELCNLYVGGHFSSAGSLGINSVNNIAYYNYQDGPFCGGFKGSIFSTWNPLNDFESTANGTSGPVKSLFYNYEDSQLYVGGYFEQVGESQIANNIAVWEIDFDYPLDYSAWNVFPDSFATGTNAPVNALSYFPDYYLLEFTLFMGGRFSMAGDSHVKNIGCYGYGISGAGWCNDVTYDLDAEINSLVFAPSIVLFEGA